MRGCRRSRGDRRAARGGWRRGLLRPARGPQPGAVGGAAGVAVRLVGVRHEQAAAYAADGYARATGRLGVALTTTGPGAANTLGAVGEAWASRSPILVIATDIPSTLRRAGVYRGVLHETAGQADMFRPVVVASEVVRDAEGVGPGIARAIAGAAGGPSYLEVPTDLLAAPATSPRAARTDRPRVDGDAAYELIDAAERPLIWAGSGARDRAPELRALAERLAAPVLTTYGARGVLPPEHPCAVGMPPHVEAAGRLWDEADLVIAFGSDLDGMNTQNWLQPQPPRARGGQRGRRRRDEELRGRRGGRRARRRAPAPARRRPARAPARGPRRGLPHARRARAALPRRRLLRAARGRQRRLRHVHPGLLDRRLPRLPPAAPAPVPDGLGHARLRLPGRARGVARRNRPDGLDLR